MPQKTAAPESDPRFSTSKATVALGLSFAAGEVDVVGYKGLYQIFVANMTGNTVHLADTAVNARLSDASLAASVLGAFLLGSLVGRGIIEVGARKQFRTIASATILVEAALIALAIALSRLAHTSHGIAVLAILALAMGIQTATLTRVGPLTVHTTFVTGMLNKLAQLISHTLFLSYDLLRGRQQVRATRNRSARRALFIFSVWFLYLAGAAAGAWLQGLYEFQALWVPFGILLIAVIVDQAAPLSIQEEQEELSVGR